MLEEMRNIAFLDVGWGLIEQFFGFFGSFGAFQGLVDDGIGLTQEDGFLDVDLSSVDPEQLFVEIVSDSAAVLDLADHVLENVPFEVQGVLLLIQSQF